MSTVHHSLFVPLYPINICVASISKSQWYCHKTVYEHWHTNLCSWIQGQGHTWASKVHSLFSINMLGHMCPMDTLLVIKLLLLFFNFHISKLWLCRLTTCYSGMSFFVCYRFIIKKCFFSFSLCVFFRSSGSFTRSMSQIATRTQTLLRALIGKRQPVPFKSMFIEWINYQFTWFLLLYMWLDILTPSSQILQ